MSPAPLSIVTNEQGSAAWESEFGPRFPLRERWQRCRGPVLRAPPTLNIVKNTFLTGHLVAAGSCHIIFRTVQ